MPHHLTQRGNARQYILNRDEDRAVYLKLLRENIEVYNVSLRGYCLMSNHVHLIVVPTLPDGLALACGNAHGRCILERDPRCKRARLARALLFLPSGRSTSVGGVALHGTESCQGWLVSEPECWPWSSAVVHCGKTQAVPWVADSLWRNRWTVAAWRDYLAASEARSAGALTPAAR